MKFDYGFAIDSNCFYCGGKATSWFRRTNGTRRYLCKSCAEPLVRFGAAEELGDLADHPLARECVSCANPTLEVELHEARKTCDDCDVRDIQTVDDAEDMVQAGEWTETEARAVLEEALGEDEELVALDFEGTEA